MMIKVFFSIIFISLISQLFAVNRTNLIAKTYFIKLGNFEYISNIQKLIKLYKYDQLYMRRHKNSTYAVYLVNIPNKQLAKQKLKEVHHLIDDAYIGIISNNTFLKNIRYTNMNAYKPIRRYTKNNKNFFISAGIGYSIFDIKNNIQNDLITNNALDNQALTYEFNLGYYFYKSIFSSFFINSVELKKAKITNIGITTNYQFINNYLNPYIGLLVGYSNLIWSDLPVKNVLKSDNSQSNFLYGTQFGFNFKIEDNIFAYSQYKFMMLNHKANINTTNSIRHNSQNLLTMGIRYAF